MPDESKKTPHLSKLAWILIALAAALIGVWTIWASRQAGLRSIWAPE
jgi:hypothetical protein